MLYRTLVSRPVQLAGFVPIGTLALWADFRFSVCVLARNPTVSTPFAEETFNQNAGHLKTSPRGIGWHLLLYHWVCSRRAIGCESACRQSYSMVGFRIWWYQPVTGNVPDARCRQINIAGAVTALGPCSNFLVRVPTGWSVSEWREIPTWYGDGSGVFVVSPVACWASRRSQGNGSRRVRRVFAGTADAGFPALLVFLGWAASACYAKA